MKRTIIIILVLALAAAGVYYFYFRTPVKPIEWRTSKIEKGDIKVVVTATGTLSAVTTVQVGTQVSGVIQKLYADFNSQVKAGQVIAKLDPTLLEAAVEDAKAGLEKAKALTNQTKRDLDRTQTLTAKDFAAQADLDAAKSAYEQAVASESSAKAQLDRAKINLKYAIITAPISGVVIQRSVDVGQTVAASFNTPTLFAIANDLTKMQVQASIDEADIGQVKVGQDVSFTVDAYPGQKFGGNVMQIRLQPNVVSNVVTYIVIVNVPNPDLKLMPGMTANITVNVTEHDNILKVPIASLRFTPPDEYIQQYKDAKANTPGDTSKKNKKWAGNGTGKPGGAGGAGAGKSNGKSSAAQDLVAGSKGKIWIKDSTRIRPIRITIGLSDATDVEVSSDELKDGQDVVLGILSGGTSGSKTTQQNPFSPTMGGANRGGGAGQRRGF